MSKDLEMKLFAYIAALEDVNQRLLTNLEMSVKLLAQFKPLVSDPQGFQKVLEGFQEVISSVDTEIVEFKIH